MWPPYFCQAARVVVTLRAFTTPPPVDTQCIAHANADLVDQVGLMHMRSVNKPVDRRPIIAYVWWLSIFTQRITQFPNDMCCAFARIGIEYDRRSKVCCRIRYTATYSSLIASNYNKTNIWILSWSIYNRQKHSLPAGGRVAISLLQTLAFYYCVLRGHQLLNRMPCRA